MSLESKLSRIKRNSVALLAGDVTNKASTFIIYAMLARYSGVQEFGQLAYGLTLLYMFHVFAAAGLPTLLTRQVARHRGRTKHFLYNGYLAAALPSAIATACMLLFALLMGYRRETVLVIGLLSLAIFPYALTMITEAVIRGREEMALIAISNLPGNLAMIVTGWLVLHFGLGVVVLAGVVAAARMSTFLVANRLLHWKLGPGEAAGAIRFSEAWRLLKSSMVFLGSDGIDVLRVSLDAILLSKFASEREIGLLSSSYQLLQPALLVYRSVGHGSFPALCAAAKTSAAQVGVLSRSLIYFLLRLSLPAAVGLFVLAADLLGIVYGNADFRSAAFVLQILSLTLMLDLINPVLGHGLWAMARERTVLNIVIVNLLVSVVAGILMISQFGLLGAACSVLTASFVSVAQHYFYFSRDVSPLSFPSDVLRLVPAAGLLVACVAFLPFHRYVSLTVGIMVYMVLAFPEWRVYLWRPAKKNVLAS